MTKSKNKSWVGKRLLMLALCLSMLTGMPALHANAAGAVQVQAQIRPDITIYIDGAQRTFYDASAKELQPIAYNGTTYLPIRAIGELMGKNVDWNQNSLTVTLAGTRGIPAVTGTPDNTVQAQTISAQLRQDFTIVVDGATRTFTDANGATVYPLLYSGSTYLPVRAIGELMGKRVAWDGSTNTVTLDASETGSLVTDADSFSNGNQTAQQPAGGQITADQAKAKALSHAGLSQTQVTFVSCKLDWEHGRQVYDVEFYTADYKEYDYEIDANTGAVVSFDYDVEHYTPSGTPSNARITVEQAKQAALSHAGLSANQVTFVQQKLDLDDGQTAYEIEFYTADYKEYDYEIDANTGAVISFDYEAEGYTRPSTGVNGNYIGEAKAREIALGKVPGATAANVIQLELDWDDGRAEYEVKIIYHEREYEFEIDATTGNIRSMENESIYD